MSRAWRLPASRPLQLLLLNVLGSAAAVAAPAYYRLDPDHSFVHFEVVHFGTSTLRGRFGPLSGDVMLDREAGRGDVGMRVATARVSTGLAVLDARLRQADLLASDEYPEAFFVATRFRFEDGKVAEVRGEFTWRGTSMPLSLFALRFGCRNDARGEVCGGDFEGEFLRGEFGATFGLPLVSNRVGLRVQVEAVRQ